MAPKPDPKRARSELSSSSETEMAGLTLSDRAMLDEMHVQLKKLEKLDLLHEMLKDIADLKQVCGLHQHINRRSQK